MTYIAAAPEWFGAAVLGAIIASLSYVAKTTLESWSQWRRSRAASLRRLLELASLLHASREIFRHQNRLMKSLVESLNKHHPDIVPDRPGYERHFSQAFASFTPDEVELHAIIRSMTQNALRIINQSMSDWLRSDLTYRVARGSDVSRARLASKLNQLDTHLRLWHAKYDVWIPNHPQHTVVYLADEETHGAGFPSGLDEVVTTVLQEMKVSLPHYPRGPLDGIGELHQRSGSV
jgi:hypothetical protein